MATFTVAFEVTMKSDRGSVEVLEDLATRVEAALRDQFPDYMMRRLDATEVIAATTEGWA